MNNTKEILINSTFYYKFLVNDVNKTTKKFWKEKDFK